MNRHDDWSTADVSTLPRPKRYCQTTLIVAIILLVVTTPASPLLADDFLSTGEVAAISGGSLSLYWLSHELKNLDTNRTPIIKGPLFFEASVQRFFGGECRPGKLNFLDDSRGSVYTSIAFGLLLTANDFGYHQAKQGQEYTQDLFLYVMGLAATAGITHTTKAIVSRPRPYVILAPADKPIRRGYHDDRTSFFSGHASSAFFAATFVNLRMRATMRAQLLPSKYHNWRWAPPSLSFGWATFVGLSRIHAYKHYLSDVLLGAAVGYLLGELFYSWAKDSSMNSEPQSSPPLMKVTFYL